MLSTRNIACRIDRILIVIKKNLPLGQKRKTHTSLPYFFPSPFFCLNSSRMMSCLSLVFVVVVVVRVKIDKQSSCSVNTAQKSPVQDQLVEAASWSCANADVRLASAVLQQVPGTVADAARVAPDGGVITRIR